MELGSTDFCGAGNRHLPSELQCRLCKGGQHLDEHCGKMVSDNIFIYFATARFTTCLSIYLTVAARINVHINV
jgi:hypothetical protein